MSVISDFWGKFSKEEYSEAEKEEIKPLTQDEKENSDNYSTVPLMNDILIKPKED